MAGTPGPRVALVLSRIGGLAAAGFLLFAAILVEALRCFDACPTDPATIARIRMSEALLVVAAVLVGVGPFLRDRRLGAGMPLLSGLLVAGLVGWVAFQGGDASQSAKFVPAAVALVGGLGIAALRWAGGPRRAPPTPPGS